MCKACEEIPDDAYSRVSASFVMRLLNVIAANGGYMENISILFFIALEHPLLAKI